VPGKNVVALNLTNNNILPYTLSWSYRTVKPANDPKALVVLTTSLGAEQAKEGDTVKLSATIENVSNQGQGMTVAILGLPTGLSLPADSTQLNAMTKQGRISAWEVRGRELVLYWRELAANAKTEIELDLVCGQPGTYRGPVSRLHGYHDAERPFWVEPLNIRIEERK